MIKGFKWKMFKESCKVYTGDLIEIRAKTDEYAIKLRIRHQRISIYNKNKERFVYYN